LGLFRGNSFSPLFPKNIGMSIGFYYEFYCEIYNYNCALYIITYVIACGCWRVAGRRLVGNKGDDLEKLHMYIIESLWEWGTIHGAAQPQPQTQDA
jgi:hypothetical protein